MILISPWSKRFNWPLGPKDYPFWESVLAGIGEPVVQIGMVGEPQLTPDFRCGLSLSQISQLLQECRVWVGVDNFLQHLNHHCGMKTGVVLWGMSDPKIFGYSYNHNLLKDEMYLRMNQFWIWNTVAPRRDIWVEPSVVIDRIIYPEVCHGSINNNASISSVGESL